MVAVCVPDEVVPGVGVWTPGIDQLECDASRLAKVGHSVKRLNIHVHDSAVLGDALSRSQDTVRELRIEYHCGTTFNSLKWALEELHQPLSSLTVVGLKLNTYEVSTLYTLYKNLSQTLIDSQGECYLPPERVEPDAVIRGDDWWYRLTGDTATMMVAYMPLCDPEARNLVVDCDGFFHSNWIPKAGFDSLVLRDVQTDLSTLFKFADELHIPKLTIQSRNPEMGKWAMALETRLKLRGIRFRLEIV